MLLNLAESLLKYQDESGMFYQLVDKIEDRGNYLETSGSALIAYAFLKGSRSGMLPKRFKEQGIRILKGILDKYLCVKKEGELSI